MSAFRARARLIALVTGEVLALVALHRAGAALAVGWDDPAAWLAATPPADAVVTALRYAGLAVGWWLLGATAAYLLARLARLPRAAATAGRLVLPGIRRTVDRAVAAGATASLLVAAAPALAAPAPPPAAPPPVVAPADTPEDASADAPVGPPAPGSVPAAAPGPAARDAPVEGGVPDAHVVARGEHLWGIAAATVAAVTGRTPEALPVGDVAAYWLRLIDANRDRLRSGDPDLVHPGERLVLPPVADDAT